MQIYYSKAKSDEISGTCIHLRIELPIRFRFEGEILALVKSMADFLLTSVVLRCHDRSWMRSVKFILVCQIPCDSFFSCSLPIDFAPIQVSLWVSDLDEQKQNKTQPKLPRISWFGKNNVKLWCFICFQSQIKTMAQGLLDIFPHTFNWTTKMCTCLK